MQKEWIIANNNETEKPLIERLLSVRGITKKTDIKDFLNPLEMKLTDPKVFTDMGKTVERIAEAINEKQKIVVYGDFDADGITSTSILMKTLKHLEAEVDYYIPTREDEGHGMNTKTLVNLMTNKKPKVLITVDCGVSNVEEVKFLNTFGLDVIITDHHEAPEILPEAFAIINPKAQNALDEKLSVKKISELTSLAGCGVALKLAQALLKKYEKPEFIYEILPFVAVGTIADIVPLVGENRYFVMKGLELISKGQHYGLLRLIENSGNSLESINSDTIAFSVAPRINAAGRLDNVDTALKIFLSDNKQEIEIAVQTLNELNKIRQSLCESTFQEAEEMLLKEGNTGCAIVLFKKDWNVGVIGIVASKLVEKYYKPAFVMTLHEESNTYKCSARSVKGINLYDAIDANSELLEGFGGHEMAAGLSFSPDKVSFEEIKNKLNETINEMLNGRTLNPFVNIDLELSENDLDISLCDEIAKLEPFGAANPSPVFAIKNLTLKEKKLMGENKNHLRLTVQGENSSYTCVWWGRGDISLISGDKLDIAFSPKINTFREVTSLQLMLEDIHSDNLQDDKSENQDEIKVYDHRKKTDILSQVEDYVKTSKLNILVYCENQDVLNTIKPYKSLFEKVVTRQSLKNADAIMFFDYPPTHEAFEAIMKKVLPRYVHYMACDYLKFNEQNLLKTFSGMIRYTCNSKDGMLDIERSSSFLGITDDCVETLVSIFVGCKMIKILEQNEKMYKLEFLQNIEMSQTLKCIQYADFKEQLDDMTASKLEFFKHDTPDFVNLCNK